VAQDGGKFAVVTGDAAGALTGLLFVAVSLTRILDKASPQRRAVGRLPPRQDTPRRRSRRVPTSGGGGLHTRPGCRTGRRPAGTLRIIELREVSEATRMQLARHAASEAASRGDDI
jgi:hypothetical protein